MLLPLVGDQTAALTDCCCGINSVEGTPAVAKVVLTLLNLFYVWVNAAT